MGRGCTDALRIVPPNDLHKPPNPSHHLVDLNLDDQVVWSGYEVETQTFRDIVSNLYGAPTPSDFRLSHRILPVSSLKKAFPPLFPIFVFDPVLCLKLAICTVPVSLDCLAQCLVYGNNG